MSKKFAILTIHCHKPSEFIYITSMDLVYIPSLEKGPEIGTTSSDWAQQRKFLQDDRDGSQSPKHFVLTKTRDNV
jgi:hypothetical protein